MESNFYDVRNPVPDLTERQPNVVEVEQADNGYRRGRGFDRPFAYEGQDQSQRGAFAQGVVSAHQGAEHYAERLDHTGMAPAPRFEERARQTYDVTIAGQADGRVDLGAHNSEPTWDHVPDAALGNFADATRDDQHGIYEAKISGEGGRRRNAAQVFRP